MYSRTDAKNNSLTIAKSNEEYQICFSDTAVNSILVYKIQNAITLKGTSHFMIVLWRGNA